MITNGEIRPNQNGTLPERLVYWAETGVKWMVKPGARGTESMQTDLRLAANELQKFREGQRDI